MNHLEQLVAEWYEYNGYFVRRNIHAGKLITGGHECELDIVAFCPQRQHLVQVEPSLDCNKWEKKEIRYIKKFNAGRKYIPALFSGLDIPTQIDQIALFTYVGKIRSSSELAGGRVLLTEDLFEEIRNILSTRTINSNMISEQFPLMRTIQHCAQYWKQTSSSKDSYNKSESLFIKGNVAL